MLRVNLTEISFEGNLFIKYAEFGVISNHSEVRYCIVKYDESKYSDDLFFELKIPFPSMLENAVVKRKSEYLAGRYCGQRLLRGYTSFEIIGSDGRIPRWPCDWCGSISHSDQYAMVVVAPKSMKITLGIDIEKIYQEDIFRISDAFATDEEKKLLRSSKMPHSLSLLVLFSAKESLYKSIWNEVKRFIDFKAARIINLDVLNREFSLVLTESFTSNLNAGMVFHGRYFLYGQMVITCILTQEDDREDANKSLT